MTDQIKTVNVYDEARKALAEITAIEGVTEGPWTWRNDDIAAQHIAACDPATMQSIAALVSAQDARIDAQDAQIVALREHIVQSNTVIEDWVVTYASDHCDDNDVRSAWTRIYASGGTLAYAADQMQRNASVIANTTEAAKAYEAGIRADERERHLSIIQKYGKDNGAQSEWDNEGAAMEVACVEISDAIRAMGGKADE